MSASCCPFPPRKTFSCYNKYILSHFAREQCFHASPFCTRTFAINFLLQAECRLQMEAQHISLTQIHAAQLELLQEGGEARTHSQELRIHTDQGEHTFLCVGFAAKTGFMVVSPADFFILNQGFFFSVECIFLHHQLQMFFFYSPFVDEAKRNKFNSIGEAVTEECNRIIEVTVIKDKPFSFNYILCEDFFPPWLTLNSIQDLLIRNKEGTECFLNTDVMDMMDALKRCLLLVFNLMFLLSVLRVWKGCWGKSLSRVSMQKDGRRSRWTKRTLSIHPPLCSRPAVICSFHKCSTAQHTHHKYSQQNYVPMTLVMPALHKCNGDFTPVSNCTI